MAFTVTYVAVVQRSLSISASYLRRRMVEVVSVSIRDGSEDSLGGRSFSTVDHS